MSKRTQNQGNRVVRILMTPIRVLGKACDLYVRSMTSCASRVSYGHSMAALPSGESSLYKSYSIGSSASADTDDYRELIRAASARDQLDRNDEVKLYLQELKLRKVSSVNGGLKSKKMLPKSVSVGMGFMGRIDEDNTCDQFEEKNEGGKVPRSKSYAVGKKRVLL